MYFYTLNIIGKVYIEVKEYAIQRAVVLSNEQRVFADDRTIYTPVYYAMFLQPSETDTADLVAI